MEAYICYVLSFLHDVNGYMDILFVNTSFVLRVGMPAGAFFFRQKSSNFQIACPQGLFFLPKSSDFQLACPQGLFFLPKQQG